MKPNTSVGLKLKTQHELWIALSLNPTYKNGEGIDS
jgi:hypothetical protein